MDAIPQVNVSAETVVEETAEPTVFSGVFIREKPTTDPKAVIVAVNQIMSI